MHISLTKKCRKKKEQYKEDQTGEWLFSIPLDNKSLSACISYMNLLFVQLLRNFFYGKITILNAWRKRKKNKYKELNIREGFSIPQYNLSLLTCISNMQFPSYTIAVIS